LEQAREMMKYFCLLCLSVLIACSAEPDSVDDKNKTANAHTQLMANARSWVP